MPSFSIATSSPRFGGCLDLVSGNITQCAFNPGECSSPLQYVKANDIPGSICSHAAQIPIGRCTSSVDQNICTISSDACVVSQRFLAKDSGCSVVQDMSSQSSASAYYPQCGDRCVISPQDCEVTETFRQIGSLVWRDPCECNDIPTGICYLDDIFPITADSSFCAVGEYDCPDSYSFMNATTLMNLKEKMPRSCTLCRQVDIIEAKMQHENVVEAGGCYIGDVFQKCALESTECPSGTTFKSSVEVRQLNQVPCPADEIVTGKCTSSMEQIDCTGNAEGCFLPVKFEKNEVCTVHSNKETNVASMYGMCRESSAEGGNWRKHRCVWKKSECVEKIEIYWHARQPEGDWLEACQCEHTQTGGCAYSNGFETLYYCAVTELGCADPSSYLTSFEMNAIGQTCMLCQPKRDRGSDPTFHPTTSGHGNIISNNGKIPEKPTISPTPSPTPRPTPLPTPRPTSRPTPRPTQSPITHSNEENTFASTQTDSKVVFSYTGLIYAVVAIIVVVPITVLITRRSMRKENVNSSNDNNEDNVRIPVNMNLDADGATMPNSGST